MKFSTKAERLQLNEATARLVVKGKPQDGDSALVRTLWQEEGDQFYSGWPEEGGVQHALGVWLVKDTSRAALAKSVADVAAWAKKLKAATLAVELDSVAPQEALVIVAVLAQALAESSYRYDAFKRDAKPVPLQEVVFFAPEADQDALAGTLNVAQVTASAVAFAKDLANAPANLCTPEFLANAAAERAKSCGAEAKIHTKADIEALGMGSFLSVAKGSDVEPRFIELSYSGAADKNAAPVVLVGKGLTFDSGGISLKPGESMDEMKYDMCGAATVIAAFCAAAELKLPINLKALVPSCENMPSGRANKPGDIVKSLKGISIEVLNTDAEGRLVLCDALTYAERFKPRAVVDVATLTGACVIALGHVNTGLVANNQDLADALLAAGREVNDRAWQLPLDAEYRDQLKSNFADLANIGGRPAGTLTAAAFLSYFTEDYTWAHLDIAGTAWQSGKEKGATGRPVPLLLTWLRHLAGH